MERESVDFHKKVVAGYRDLADRYPERILKVDAALQVQEIHDIIVANIEKKLGLE